MGRLTVRDLLELPIIRRAEPEVLAGADHLDRVVRWVHSSELADIAPLLRAGELVLSTGIALPEDPAGLQAFAASLVEVEAAGLLIELGRRWHDQLPDPLVQACAQAELPLIVLRQEVRFAAVAQVMGERIVDEQLAELRTSERIHETFTELSVNEAGPKTILAAAQRLSGTGVVLENEHHRVIDYVTGPTAGALLEDWYDRSRRVVTADRTSWDSRNGWLIARVGRRDRGWGRLVLQVPEEPAHHLYVVAERAAAALALHRLHDRDRHNALRRTQRELVLALLADPDDAETHRRCELAGFPMTRRQFVGLTIRPVGLAARARTVRASLVDDVLAATVLAAHRAQAPALVCEIDGDVRVLLSLTPSSDAAAPVDTVAQTVAGMHEVVIGAGRPTRRAGAVDETLRESLHVVASVTDAGAGPLVHRLEDTHLRGLLTLLHDDERVAMFATRELAPLLDRRAPDAEQLLATLRALLDHPGSKADAAAALHLSRPAFYGRLAKLQRALGRDPQDPETRTSLHVALLVHDQRAAGST